MKHFVDWNERDQAASVFLGALLVCEARRWGAGHSATPAAVLGLCAIAVWLLGSILFPRKLVVRSMFFFGAAALGIWATSLFWHAGSVATLAFLALMGVFVAFAPPLPRLRKPISNVQQAEQILTLAVLLVITAFLARPEAGTSQGGEFHAAIIWWDLFIFVFLWVPYAGVYMFGPARRKLPPISNSGLLLFAVWILGWFIVLKRFDRTWFFIRRMPVWVSVVLALILGFGPPIAAVFIRRRQMAQAMNRGMV